jgi:hypothetical protein
MEKKTWKMLGTQYPVLVILRFVTNILTVTDRKQSRGDERVGSKARIIRLTRIP